ncbi:MAG: glycosyltransferase family 1 protein, partial [Clostridia bacterium]|nr:glycosyltransferase family 1 protein [Clostridia bacterium]
MPPMEALTCGTNCVISDIPVFKEIYKDLPVVYFETENIEDLSKKILQSLDMPKPEILNNPYSFERTYSIINNTFQGKF